MRVNKLAASLALLAAPAMATAAPFTLFTEDFAEELTSIAPANQANNFAALDQFTITRGTVDLFGDGGFGLSCPSTGCLDLDGSTSAAVRMETAALGFLAGVDYTLSFNISGNQRGGADDTLTVGIDNGILADQVLTRAPADPYGVVSYMFTVAADTTGKLFFDHAGGDNLGILLDRVDIVGEGGAAVVPLPATLPLIVGALGLMGFAGARRRA